MSNGLDHLVRVVVRRLRELRVGSPSAPVVRAVFDRIYLASMRTEENRFVRGSFTFANPDSPEADSPQLRRADYPSFVAFGRHQMASPGVLAKLSRAIDQWSGSIAIYGENPQSIFIWGVVDQMVQNNVLLNREAERGFSHAGVLTIIVDGVGSLSAYHSNIFLGSVRGDRVIDREDDTFHSTEMWNRLIPHIAPLAEGIAQSIGKPNEKLDCYSRVFNSWASTMCRLCITVRRMGTGGSFLLSAAPNYEILEIVNNFEYNRLGDAVALNALDEMHAEIAEEENWRDDETESVPFSLVMDAHLAAADMEDRKSELTGAAKLVASLASTDGLVLMSPLLNVKGFGVKIKAAASVRTVYDGLSFEKHGKAGRKIDLSQFGTRHGSMIRYCRSDPAAVGVVISQDGQTRLICTSRRSLVLWENVKLLGHQMFSAAEVRRLADWRKSQLSSSRKVKLGYSRMPKTVAALLESIQ